MTPIRNTLSSICEIENFVITSPSGDILDHDLNKPEEIASLVAICGLGSNAMMEAIEFSRFNYLQLSRVDSRNFIIFRYGENYLGIQQVAGADSSSLASKLRSAINLKSTTPGAL